MESPSVGGEVVAHLTQVEQLNVDEADVVFVLTHLESQAGGVYHISLADARRDI